MFKKSCCFLPRNFKISAVKTNHIKIYLQRNIYKDFAWKYGNITVKDFRKYEKLEYKKNKLKLDIDFLNNCKQLGVYPKFLIFKLPNVSNKDALSIRKTLFRSTINKRNTEPQHVSKEISLSENFLYLNTILLLTSTSLQNL